MRKLKPYFLGLLLTLCASGVQAQYEDYDSAYAPPAVDSVGSIDDLMEDSYDDERATAPFEQLTLADKASVTTRKVGDSAVTTLRKDDDFWYVNEAPKKEEPPKKKPSTLDNLAKKEWFRNLLWVLVVGGFVAVLIWFIISSDIQLFKKQSTAITKQEEDEDLVNQSIFDINYDQEIQKAISNQNFRLAIRLLYLQTLKRLSEENIINYKQERTNSDYLMQVFNTQYYKDFFRLTRHFEYAWYGQFPVAPASFEVIKTEFTNFKQRFLSWKRHYHIF